MAVLCSLGSGQSGARSGSTVAADRQACAVAGVAVSVVDEETGRAGELVGLSRHDPHREFLPGQVRPGQLEASYETLPRCLPHRRRPAGTVPRCAAPGALPENSRPRCRVRCVVVRRSRLPSLRLLSCPCAGYPRGSGAALCRGVGLPNVWWAVLAPAWVIGGIVAVRGASFPKHAADTWSAPPRGARSGRPPACGCQGLSACRAAMSQGVSQLTPAGVRCTPSLRTVMLSTVAV